MLSLFFESGCKGSDCFVTCKSFAEKISALFGAFFVSCRKSEFYPNYAKITFNIGLTLPLSTLSGGSLYIILGMGEFKIQNSKFKQMRVERGQRAFVHYAEREHFRQNKVLSIFNFQFSTSNCIFALLLLYPNAKGINK